MGLLSCAFIYFLAHQFSLQIGFYFSACGGGWNATVDNLLEPEIAQPLRVEEPLCCLRQGDRLKYYRCNGQSYIAACSNSTLGAWTVSSYLEQKCCSRGWVKILCNFSRQKFLYAQCWLLEVAHAIVQVLVQFLTSLEYFEQIAFDLGPTTDEGDSFKARNCTCIEVVSGPGFNLWVRS